MIRRCALALALLCAVLLSACGTQKVAVQDSGRKALALEEKD